MNIFFDIDTSGLELQDRICAMGIYAQEIALYELVDPEKKFHHMLLHTTILPMRWYNKALFFLTRKGIHF